jgi:hypothetical protein
VRALLEHGPADGAAIREAEVRFDLAPPVGRKAFRLTASRLARPEGGRELVLVALEDVPGM